MSHQQLYNPTGEKVAPITVSSAIDDFNARHYAFTVESRAKYLEEKKLEIERATKDLQEKVKEFRIAKKNLKKIKEICEVIND